MGYSGHGSRPENFSDHGQDLPQKCKALAFAWSYHKPNLMNAKIISLLLGLSLGLYSCNTQPKVDSAIKAGKVDINWSNTLKLARGPVTLMDS
jgi:hypothetical protein